MALLCKMLRCFLEMGKRNNRINWIDVAKAIGILLIVLSHTLENGLFRQAIFSFHVPLFFFLSGLTYHGAKKGAWKKRFFRLYLPYIIFSLVSIMVFAVAAHFLPGLLDANVSIGKGIVGMLYGNARTGNMKWNEPLWFIPCLIAVYALADITELGLSNVKPSMRFGGV